MNSWVIELVYESGPGARSPRRYLGDGGRPAPLVGAKRFESALVAEIKARILRGHLDRGSFAASFGPLAFDVTFRQLTRSEEDRIDRHRLFRWAAEAYGLGPKTPYRIASDRLRDDGYENEADVLSGKGPLSE